ncbi:asparagine synthase (glutamine-hydrolyzing) [Ichthyenterobacterium sp. W332]|uniref:asparagine synthase (glutamine-hydrolyzing) n=1 Tax=Microcosmobacter mediterraneus TaxID=3075607 RepID=A0ABU2YKN5_9FLAO|nr:asparagine synthase (glutamine-hydrolyzing) [Ichthyenterobacterium sp. W332]MDT0558729.1 asparagine synthase (glutamine-hydrolyzing) [Ichthyenterobacterium sp. W332]
MCGINGLIYKTEGNKNTVEASVNTMNDLIIHRGPDDDGIYTNSNANSLIGMGMRRLSIIDLNSGKQPISNEDDSITIVFNGEIYNYKTLREDLISNGYTFKTESDTEVILKLYEHKGPEGFSLLDGMYAFSIYDTKKNKVYIARDFFGEKPLYYTKTEKAFIYASELKSLISNLGFKPEISRIGMNLFFRLTYIPAPYTIYKNIHKLEANTFIELDLKDFNFSTNEVYKINATKSNLNFEDAKKIVKEKVSESVESRSVSDVPIGTFLSGGVDSSVVSLCLADQTDSKIDTFSIGFEKATYDESDKSRTVANLINSNHHEFIINELDLKTNLDDILLNFDEPFADSSALPTFLVSNKTSKHLKVALTGDGGDEIFGGYNKYYVGKLNNKYTSTVPKWLHHSVNNLSKPLLNRKDDNRGLRYKIQKFLNSVSYDNSHYWNIISLGLTETDIKTFLQDPYIIPNIFDYYKEKTGINSPKSLNDFRVIDKHISLEGDMLVKVDRTSMLNSLECRAPFLNRDLFEFTLGLPEDFLLKSWNKKFILKEAFRDRFPEKFLDISKQGFGVPVGDWLRQSLKSELEHYINPEFLDKQNIFEKQDIISLVKNHISGKIDNSFKVWSYFCFQKWYTSIYQNL